MWCSCKPYWGSFSERWVAYSRITHTVLNLAYFQIIVLSFSSKNSQFFEVILNCFKLWYSVELICLIMLIKDVIWLKCYGLNRIFSYSVKNCLEIKASWSSNSVIRFISPAMWNEIMFLWTERACLEWFELVWISTSSLGNLNCLYLFSHFEMERKKKVKCSERDAV